VASEISVKTLAPVAMPPVDIDVEASWQTLETEAGHYQEHAGLGIWKSVDDLARYRVVIERDQPEVVVEIGTRWGGFAAWISDEFGVSVITVDIERTPGRPDAWRRVRYVRGDSTSAAVARTVHRLVARRRCMVTLDGDHHAPVVEREIATYGPLVTPGCALVVEDGLADLLPADRARRLGGRIPERGGPLRAVATTVYRRHEWIRDLAVENMSAVSHSPGGWWIRSDR
jgi:cephalosporin hydroxylase